MLSLRGQGGIEAKEILVNGRAEAATDIDSQLRIDQGAVEAIATVVGPPAKEPHPLGAPQHGVHDDQGKEILMRRCGRGENEHKVGGGIVTTQDHAALCQLRIFTEAHGGHCGTFGQVAKVGFDLSQHRCGIKITHGYRNGVIGRIESPVMAIEILTVNGQ